VVLFDLDCAPTRDALQQLARQCPAELVDAAWVGFGEEAVCGCIAELPREVQTFAWPTDFNSMKEAFAASGAGASPQDETALASRN
jgi:hypothetical protein